MNTRTLLFAGAAFVAAAIFSPAFAADAEADFAAFNTLKAARPPASPKEMGVDKYYRWMDDSRRQTQAAGLAFFAAHGADPRRWEVVQAIAGSAPLYIKSIGDDVEKRGPAAIVADEDAKAAWEKRADELRRALLAAPDAAPKLKEEVDWYYFAKDFRATSAAKTKGEKYDYAPFRPRFSAPAPATTSAPWRRTCPAPASPSGNCTSIRPTRACAPAPRPRSRRSRPCRSRSRSPSPPPTAARSTSRSCAARWS
jgi:hypothetical protein